MSRPAIAVVYLARYAEGAEPLRRFIESYQRHPAGADHDLIVVFKGCRDREVGVQPGLFQRVKHVAIHMADEGFDLGAYRFAARSLNHELICCLNTFVEIEANDWLRKLQSYATNPNVGIVGSTASFESVRDSMKGMSKAVWFAARGAPYDRKIAKLWGHEIIKHAPEWQTSQRNLSLYRRLRRTAASGLIHSDDSQTARSSSSSRYESRNCRQGHTCGSPSA
jgi:hypothetical protein